MNAFLKTLKNEILDSHLKFQNHITEEIKQLFELMNLLFGKSKWLFFLYFAVLGIASLDLVCHLYQVTQMFRGKDTRIWRSANHFGFKKLFFLKLRLMVDLMETYNCALLLYGTWTVNLMLIECWIHITAFLLCIDFPTWLIEVAYTKTQHNLVCLTAFIAAMIRILFVASMAKHIENLYGNADEHKDLFAHWLFSTNQKT